MRNAISVCLLATVLFTGAAAADRVVFATGEYPPYISEQAPDMGPVARIVTEACRRAGIEPVFEFLPWKRASVSVLNGQYVASFHWARTAAREQKGFLFSEQPVVTAPTVVFYRRSKFPEGVTFDAWSDLKAHRIVGVNGYWYQDEFRKLDIPAHYVNRPVQAWKMLESGRADVYVDNLHPGFTDAKHSVPDFLEDLGYTRQSGDKPHGYLMFSPVHKDAAQLRERLDAALESMHKDGTYAKFLATLLE